MTDHPSTYKGTGPQGSGIDWDDRASLHRVGDGGGLLDGAKAIREGAFAELISHVMMMPEASRAEYCIQKAGDRRFDYPEIAALHGSEDFPGGE